jgi:UDP-N-acetylglucosamine--N-acetylmuramyl-(pentapeptide) pyrophosphoryl-undecaprenol N-acetylglucosamine transferase
VSGGRGAAAQHRAPAIARVLLTGGGTGGHVYPAIAVAEALRDRFGDAAPQVLFVGSRGGLEAAIVPKAGLDAAFVASRPLERRISLGVVRTIAANAVGFAQALRVVSRFQPDCVVSTGGYVAFPVVLAARALRLLGAARGRIAMLEPNAVPGLTNRLLAPLADEIWVGATPAAMRSDRKVVVTGTPVRGSIVHGPAQAPARTALGLDPALTTIVVMGGSQGARRINDSVVEMVSRAPLPSGWQLLHVAGTRDAERVRTALAGAGSPAGIAVVAYLDDPGAAYAAADIVVARAGASTLAELAATGTPSILVPYPFAAAGHQERNADVVRAAGAARVVRDDDLDGALLRMELIAALEPAAHARMRSAARALAAFDARARVAERVAALIQRG